MRCYHVILGFLWLSTFIGCIICISYVCHLSKKDPFQRHNIGELDTYFNNILSTENLIIENNMISNSIDKDIAQIIEEERTENNSSNLSNQSKFLLRELVSTSSCNKYQNKFEKYKGDRLSKVFNLKMNKIHRISIGLIVVIWVPFLFGIVGAIILHLTKNRNNWFLILDGCLMLSSLIVNLTLLIIIIVSYKKSDIEEYDDFLDCKHVRKNYFDSNFSKVIKLKKYLLAFIILDSFFVFLEILMIIIASLEENEKEENAGAYPTGPNLSSNKLN